MSASRSLWDDSEKSLLRQIHSEIPGASLRHIWQAFDLENHQRRTKNAVKAKIKDLGLSAERDVVPTPLEEISIPSRWHSEMRYDWSIPELGIFIPLHPLIAEARQHATHIQAVGYASSVSPGTRWASVLGRADISRLRCSEADKVALRTYMNYLQK
ncbi:hypothetical protein BGZ60DRAFT_513795 [Tricladium varicosporioides]|nr:hypothetical protein BGZ60DRAFT_513795 [Hymenoscyphus varicosporioides]